MKRAEGLPETQCPISDFPREHTCICNHTIENRALGYSIPPRKPPAIFFTREKPSPCFPNPLPLSGKAGANPPSSGIFYFISFRSRSTRVKVSAVKDQILRYAPNKIIISCESCFAFEWDYNYK